MRTLFASPYPLLVLELPRNAAPWMPFGLPDGQWSRVGGDVYGPPPPWGAIAEMLATGCPVRPARTKRSR